MVAAPSVVPDRLGLPAVLVALAFASVTDRSGHSRLGAGLDVNGERLAHQMATVGFEIGKAAIGS